MYVVYEYVLCCVGGAFYVKSRLPYSTCLGIEEMTVWTEKVLISFISKKRSIQISESDFWSIFLTLTSLQKKGYWDVLSSTKCNENKEPIFPFIITRKSTNVRSVEIRTMLCRGAFYVKSRLPYSTCLGIKEMAVEEKKHTYSPPTGSHVFSLHKNC